MALDIFLTNTQQIKLKKGFVLAHSWKVQPFGSQLGGYSLHRQGGMGQGHEVFGHTMSTSNVRRQLALSSSFSTGIPGQGNDSTHT